MINTLRLEKFKDYTNYTMTAIRCGECKDPWVVIYPKGDKLIVCECGAVNIISNRKIEGLEDE